MTQAKRPARTSLPDSPTTPGRSLAPPLTWTIGRQIEFGRVLAKTCDVTSAAEAVGMTIASAYAFRKDPEQGEYFELIWDAAIEIAYDNLQAWVESFPPPTPRTRAAKAAPAKGSTPAKTSPRTELPRARGR